MKPIDDVDIKRLKELLIYDPDTGVFTRRCDHGRNDRFKKGEKVGTLNKKTGYVIVGIDLKRYMAHRLAWLYVYGNWPSAANHAIRWKRLVGPMPSFELPSERGTKEEVKWISREGIETLIEAAISESMPLHHFIKLTYWWGARRGWVERLHKSQVNLKTGRVNPYAVGEKVTVKRRLILPIFDAVKPNIEALVRSAPGNGYLFGSASVDFYRPFRRLCELVGYEDRSHPHVLRHSRATHMLMAGESIYKVARLLGDSVQTVERVYGHHSVEYLMEQEQR